VKKIDLNEHRGQVLITVVDEPNSVDVQYMLQFFFETCGHT
jgi:hypothetical protein